MARGVAWRHGRLQNRVSADSFLPSLGDKLTCQNHARTSQARTLRLAAPCHIIPPSLGQRGSRRRCGEKRKADRSEEPDCAREILEDMSRQFRSWVQEREWLNMRLGVSSIVPIFHQSVQLII
jgi:hypothetical protein